MLTLHDFYFESACESCMVSQVSAWSSQFVTIIRFILIDNAYKSCSDVVAKILACTCNFRQTACLRTSTYSRVLPTVVCGGRS